MPVEGKKNDSGKMIMSPLTKKEKKKKQKSKKYKTHIGKVKKFIVVKIYSKGKIRFRVHRRIYGNESTKVGRKMKKRNIKKTLL